MKKLNCLSLFFLYLLTSSDVISQPLTVTATSTDETGCGACDGTATANVSGGTTPYTYTWNTTPTQTDSTATGLCPGTYSVLVQDAVGSFGFDSTTVGTSGGSGMTLTPSSTDETSCGACDGSTSVSITGGTPPYTYSWNTFPTQTNSTATALCPGSYTVTVIDSNSCSDTASATVGTVGGSGMTLTTSSTDNTSCGFTCNGTATVSVTGGNTPYSYLWSTGQTDSIATGLCGGTYSVTVTDSASCSEVASITVNDSIGLLVTTSSTDETACGACDGTATASVSGGTSPYTYQWDDPLNQTGSIATGLCPGTYTVGVFDANFCFDSASVVVGSPSGMTLSTSSSDETACGDCDGSATVSVAGGAAPLTYVWSTSPVQTNTTATGLCAGTYDVTVTDANSCSVIASATVGCTSSCGFTLSTLSFDESDCGACDGVASVNVTGGINPFTYLWSDPNNQVTSFATGLCSGTYTVTVTDGISCSDTISATIGCSSGGCSFTLATTSVDATSCSACDGSATVITVGGASPLTYLWDDPNNQTSLIATGLCVDTFNVIVTDGSGCSDTATAIVGCTTTVCNISLFLVSTDALCGDSNGTAIVNVGGGVFPLTYQWDDPQLQTTSNAVGLPSGTYTVVVIDANNCSDTGSVTVNDANGPTTNITNITDVTCNSACDGSVTVSAVGGASPYTYQWDDPANQITATASGLCAGTYNVTVTDNNGCFDTQSATIVEPAGMALSVAGSDPACNGSCDGSATANVTGGTTAYTYQWDANTGFQTTQTADSLCSGTYTVTVTDASGCSVSGSVILSDPPGMLILTSTTDATCGIADGSATVTVSGGTTPYSYLWNDSTNQTTATATGLAAGGYSVVITDSSGCTQVGNVTVNDVGGPSITILSITDVSCTGGNDGSATVSASGTTPPYSYQWDDPLNQADSTATGLLAGTYNVVATDASGCSSTATVTINEPASLITSTTGTDASCNGLCDGSAAISASGGVTPYTYDWSSGGNATIESGLCAGSYAVTVTDDKGCTSTDSVTINEPASISVSITSIDPACPGSCDGSATANVTGGTIPYSYLWDDPLLQNTQAAIGLCAGPYTVVVTDANGCNSSAGVTINDPAGMTLITAASDATCDSSDGSASVSVTGGSPPYSYQWNDSLFQTTDAATGLAAGGYSVTVTDTNGCTAVANVTINDIGGPTVSIIGNTDASCDGASDGSATASATGGTSPYTYQWDDPANQTTATATGLSGGTYNVVATDANGCSASASVTINEPSAVNAVITSTTGATCNGTCDGSATVSVTGGTSPYSYQWDDPNSQTTATATGVCAGNLSVVITDTNGCVDTVAITIIEPAALTVPIVGTDPTCKGGCNGYATANVTGGTIPYSYQWDDPFFQVTQTVVGLCSDTYNVIVTDANGCSSTGSVVINDPAGMTLNTSSTDATCGNADGTAAVSITGGTSPYSYQWDDPNLQITDTAIGLAVGGYSVTVTDANGCTETANVTVNDVGGITATVINSTDVSCNGGSDGSATVFASNGTTPYTYQWDDPFTQTNTIATGLTAGTFNVVVTDSNGCSAAATVIINQPAALNAAITSSSDASCNGACDGEATVNVNGGTTPYTYQWNDTLSQTTATASGLCAGYYIVNITDSNGCNITRDITIVEPVGMSLTSTTNDATCGISDGSATVLASGGTPSYTYSWSSGGNNPTESGLSVGTYSCTVTDVNGCSQSITAIIYNSNGPSASATATNISCNSGNDGTAAATATGGTPPYSYQWDDPANQTTVTASSLTAATYSIIITDSGGCIGIASVTLTEPDSLVIITSTTDESCSGYNDGNAAVSVSGGTAPYTYSWDDPLNQTNDTAKGLTAGVVNVTVIDTNNCQVTAPVTVDVTNTLVLNFTVTDVTCQGDDDGTIDLTVTIGAAPYSYSWSNGSTGEDQIGITGGNYIVTTTDGNGCLSIDTIEVKYGTTGCLNIPPSFTPNGDGVNDTWKIRGIEPHSDILVEVFNRWGSLVFSSNGYTEHWDGTHKGKKLPSAAYYYIITLGNGELCLGKESCTGTVSIIY